MSGLLPAPEPHAIFVMVLTAVALVLFAKQDRFPLESTSLLVIAVLSVGFELVPYRGPEGTAIRGISFFSGFGHEALIAVAALMIAGQGIVRTGALEPLGRLLARGWVVHPAAALRITLLLAGALSAFMNNTPIVVLLLPILISVSLRAGTSPAGILMPMGFATLVGGMSTTIGTSTNLLVVTVAQDMQIATFGMFDFVIPGAVAGTIGILYLWLVAPRLLPHREGQVPDFSPRVFSAQLHLSEDSLAVGDSLAEALARTEGRMQVQRIGREEETFVIPLPDVRLRANDRLFVQDTPAQLQEFRELLGAELYRGNERVDDEHPLEAPEQQLAEVAVVQGSPLVGVSLRNVRFLDRYQLVALALHRSGQTHHPSRLTVADMRLRSGDVLLVQGPEQQISALKREDDLLVLDATADLPRSNRATLSLLIMLGVIIVAVAGWLPIALSATAGSLAMILTGCLSWRDATQALNSQVILIVAASLSLGAALVTTGATEYLAQVFLQVFEGADPVFILSALMVLMAVLTNVVSNNAAAVIGTPIAASIAAELGLSPIPFVLAVLFGANMSYATPMAYKTNLLVMNAGGYTFADFLKVGVPLTVILLLVFSFLLPLLYL